MNSRQRFLASLLGRALDHPPLFPEGLRPEVIRRWRKQGLPPGKHPADLFYYDDFEELLPDVYPSPALADWSDKKKALQLLGERLDPADPRRLPRGWKRSLRRWLERDYPLLLRIHPGLFLSLGVEEWGRFAEVALLLADDPGFVAEVLAVQAAFSARLAELILRQVDVDAVVFSEPIAGNHGPLISPRMFRELVLPSLAPIFEVLERFQVPVLIWRSYADPGLLVREVAASQINAGACTALWLCETPPGRLAYPALRRELGPEIALIGGIDADVLYQTPAEIRQAVETVQPLLPQGRFIPLADGRVRPDVPYANYAFYRRPFGSK